MSISCNVYRAKLKVFYVYFVLDQHYQSSCNFKGAHCFQIGHFLDHKMHLLWKEYGLKDILKVEYNDSCKYPLKLLLFFFLLVPFCISWQNTVRYFVEPKFWLHTQWRTLVLFPEGNLWDVCIKYSLITTHCRCFSAWTTLKIDNSTQKLLKRFEGNALL